MGREFTRKDIEAMKPKKVLEPQYEPNPVAPNVATPLYPLAEDLKKTSKPGTGILWILGSIIVLCLITFVVSPKNRLESMGESGRRAVWEELQSDLATLDVDFAKRWADSHHGRPGNPESGPYAFKEMFEGIEVRESLQKKHRLSYEEMTAIMREANQKHWPHAEGW